LQKEHQENVKATFSSQFALHSSFKNYKYHYYQNDNSLKIPPLRATLKNKSILRPN